MTKGEELRLVEAVVKSDGPAAALGVAAANSYLHALKWLLEEVGVDINARFPPGHQTALHTAARLGLRRSTKFLVAHGADLNALDDDLLTPLMKACGWPGKKLADVAILLIESGANVNYVRESDQMNALLFAVSGSEPEVIAALRRSGAVEPPARSENLAEKAKVGRYARLVKEGRRAFKENRFQAAVNDLESASSLAPLDPLSAKFLEVARRNVAKTTGARHQV